MLHIGGGMIGGLLTALLVLIADQASKHWILHGVGLPLRGQITLLPVLNLQMVWNHGVTFGLLSGSRAGPVVLGLVALAIVALLLNWMRRSPYFATRIALGAIIGGAIGNVIDRVRFGAVVDFIQVHWGDWSWYVFNVADAAICCGVVALLVEGAWKNPSSSQLPH